jgi:glc operon protein GlcG
MNRRTYIDAAECGSAMRAMVAAAGDVGGHKLAFAIVDEFGDPLNRGAVDGASPLVRERAFKKAYSAARAERDLKDISEAMAAGNLGDPLFIGGRGGGLAVRDSADSDGPVLGGIGVSGGPPEVDDEIARVGLEALLAARAAAGAIPQRPVLAMSDAVRMVDEMMSAAIANRHEITPQRRPAAVVVVDHHGDVLASACMAGANPAMARQNAFKKAYTAACMRSDTAALEQHLNGLGRSVRDFPNPNFSGGPGGLVLRRDGVILGGIGVSGRSGEEDQVIALAGLRAFDGKGKYQAHVSPDMRL